MGKASRLLSCSHITDLAIKIGQGSLGLERSTVLGKIYALFSFFHIWSTILGMIRCCQLRESTMSIFFFSSYFRNVFVVWSLVFILLN